MTCRHVAWWVCMVWHIVLVWLPSVRSYPVQAQRHWKRYTILRPALGEYSAAVVAASNFVERRFFFPNHGGTGPLQRLLKTRNIESLDLPELDETDNIHSPEGPLLSALQSTSRLYHAKRSWFLVNGSTGGILSAILALREIYAARKGYSPHTASPVLLVTRDSHKAVYDALSVFGIDALLIDVEDDPQWNIGIGPSTEAITNALKQYGPRIMGLVLTRPTYQGIMLHPTALKNLIDECHSSDIPVLVDEAHGAHLRFLPRSYDIQDALSCGADIVVQSAHKSLSSLSQTALMHLNTNAFSFQTDLNPEDVESIVDDSFSALTTTSPNSLLLASLDASLAEYQHNGTERLASLCALAETLKATLKKQGICRLINDLKLTANNATGCASLAVVSDTLTTLDDHVKERNRRSGDRWQVDPLKLSIHVRRCRADQWTSVRLDDTLCEEYGVYCELNLPDCVTYVLPSSFNTTSMEYLASKLIDVCRRIRQDRQDVDAGVEELPDSADPSSSTAPREHFTHVSSIVRPWRQHWRRNVTHRSVFSPSLAGCISAETISIYPPGIPLLVKGEIIGDHQLKSLQSLHRFLRQRRAADEAKDLDHSDDEDTMIVVQSGQSVTGNVDPLLSTIAVLDPVHVSFSHTAREGDYE